MSIWKGSPFPNFANVKQAYSGRQPCALPLCEHDVDKDVEKGKERLSGDQIDDHEDQGRDIGSNAKIIHRLSFLQDCLPNSCVLRGYHHLWGAPSCQESKPSVH